MGNGGGVSFEEAGRRYLFEFMAAGSQATTHPQRPVTVGDRTASVDSEMAPLIEVLWSKGYETATSCQDRGGGLAYVTFLTSHLGGDQMAAALMRNNIPYFREDAPIRIPVGVSFTLEYPAVGIVFPAERIQEVAAVMRKS